MTQATNISQKTSFGSDTTQIAIQNNYSGMSPQEASKIAIDLFLENFPKLQQEAAEIAHQRVEEITTKILEQLQKENLTDYSTFGDPDVQFTLYTAQKNYARFGTQEMLSTLSSLVAKRVKYDDDFLLKVVIDEAVSIANLLTSAQLDYLSLTFICKSVKFSGIKTIDDLKIHLEYICECFSSTKIQASHFLSSLNCLKLQLGNAWDEYERLYNFNPAEVVKICPDLLGEIDPDYGVSYIGTILAITNAELKTEYTFDPHIWIKE